MKLISKKFILVNRKNDKEIVCQAGRTVYKLIPFAEIEEKSIAQDIKELSTKYDLRILGEEV